jgi:phospholipid/cholesterol/gamma-HCH transport system ATP-binding protein
MDEPLIRLENLRKAFGENRVVDGVDLDVRRGEILTIIGKSGVGKSVLLKLMINILEPDSGRIFYLGRPLDAMSRSDQAAFRRKMSYVFQGTALLDSLTTFENVALPLQEKGVLPRGEILRRARARMDQLDLVGIDEKYPSQLSGGMRKRVALARALVTDPELVLFDEPTTGLDPIRKHAVHSLITDYQRKLGFTAVLVSHEIPDVFYLSQRIAMLDGGRVLFAGTPAALMASEDPVIREFLGGLDVRTEPGTAMAHPQELDRRVLQELSRIGEGSGALGLITLTLENLGDINSRFGFLAGQNAMKNLLAAARRSLRAGDTCARVGLDRVAVLLFPSTGELARSFGSELAASLKSAEILEGVSSAHACLSFGIGYAEAAGGGTWQGLLEVAEAKKQPLDQFTVCT